MTQHQLSDPSKWTEKQLNDWFDAGGFLNGLQIKPDPSINRRTFAIHYAAHKDTWDKAFTFLKDSDLTGMPLGRVALGDGMYANMDEYQPKDHENTCFEAHRKYIDIQSIVFGNELIGLTGLNNMTTTEPFDESKDIEFGTATTGTVLRAAPGRFFLFFPNDAHRPCMKDGNDDTKVRKIVVKVPFTT